MILYWCVLCAPMAGRWHDGREPADGLSYWRSMPPGLVPWVCTSDAYTGECERCRSHVGIYEIDGADLAAVCDEIAAGGLSVVTRTP